MEESLRKKGKRDQRRLIVTNGIKGSHLMPLPVRSMRSAKSNSFRAFCPVVFVGIVAFSKKLRLVECFTSQIWQAFHNCFHGRFQAHRLRYPEASPILRGALLFVFPVHRKWDSKMGHFQPRCAVGASGLRPERRVPANPNSVVVRGEQR
jgi:hypothetical protein